MFGLLYYAQDVFVTSHQELAKRLNLLEKISKVNRSFSRNRFPVGSSQW